MAIATAVPSGPGDELRGTVPEAVVQVLGADGGVAGAGFLAGDGVVVTCAHVVLTAGEGPGGSLSLAFPHLPGAPLVQGRVVAGGWRPAEAEDVAVVRLDSVPPGASALALGSAEGCRGHRVSSFGFPAQAPPGGHFGYGNAADLIPDTGSGPLLQLTGANDLTTGFSGAPVVDEITGLVVGMVTAITAQDRHLRGQGIAYATPTRVLREAWPDLVEQQVCPYRGLEPFGTEHAEWFHGREAAVERVLAALDGQRRVLLLLGPSGAGKSSLVRAGVLPALAEGRLPGSDRWLQVLARPGRDLPAELERAGLPGAVTDGVVAAVERRLAAEPGDRRLLVVIDQFEELFAEPLTEPDAQRQPAGGPLAVVEQLVALISGVASVCVVLVMRDDFYPRVAALAPELLEAATPGLLNVPATLSTRDLRAIITRPAEAAGARLEDGLPERIITDVLAADPTGTTARQAPVTQLPPLELALSQVWERRRDGFLTHEAYQRIGEVSGALATWCNTAVGSLPAEHRPTAQRILTALVRPADDARAIPATRQQVPMTVLRALAADTVPAGPPGERTMDEVLAALTHHRIITTRTADAAAPPGQAPGEPLAELIHDALIRDWAELRDWVAADHRFQDWLRRVGEQRARWADSGHPGDLLDGTDLAEGMAWSRQRGIPEDITAFLTASTRRQQAAARRTRRINTVLACLLAIAVIAAGLAFWQRQTAVEAQQVAQSQQLAAQSATLLDDNRDLAALLAVQAYRTSPTTEAADSLYASAAQPLRDRLSAMTGRVWAMEFSPDGHTLAIGSADGTVHLRDVQSDRTPRTLTAAREEPVCSLAFSPDGTTLATGGRDGTIRLWETATGRLLGEPEPERSPVCSLAFSPSGATLAAAAAGVVRLRDSETGAERTTLPAGHPGGTGTYVSFGPGDRLVTGSGRLVHLWNDDFTEPRTITSPDTVTAVRIDPQGQDLAVSGENGEVEVWDLAKDRYISPNYLTAPDSVTSIAYSPDGNTLATAGGNRTVRLWDPATESTWTTISAPSDVSAVAFSPDGRTLATGSDGMVHLWEVAPSSRTTLKAIDSVESVAYSPDGRYVTGVTGRLRLWLAAGAPANRRWLEDEGEDGEPVISAAFSPDGKTLATGLGDGRILLWDTARLDSYDNRPRTVAAHEDSVYAMAYSPDGRTLATSSADGTVQLREASSGRARAELRGHEGSVGSLAFSLDSRMVATADEAGTVRVWDTGSTPRVRDTIDSDTGNVGALAFAPRGSSALAFADGERVQLWDLDTRQVRAVFSGHTGEVSSVASSPDGRTLATGGDDATARLWDVSTTRTRSVLRGHTDEVTSVAFSPDGRTLATGSDDTTMRLWDAGLLEPAQAIDRICQAVGRDLTARERSAYAPDGPSAPVCPS